MRIFTSRGRVLATTLLLAATTTACPNDPSRPSAATMASRFEQLIQAHAGDAWLSKFPWMAAATALRSGAPIVEVTVEVDGRARTFQAAAVQFGTTAAGTDSRMAAYLIAWGDPTGQEMLTLWMGPDSADLGNQDPPFTTGGVALQTVDSDSAWRHDSGWAKLATRVTGETCRSSRRPSDQCRVVTMDVGASLVMRAVRLASGTSTPTTSRLELRAARVRGVYILQPCDPNACSVSFP